MGDIQNRPFSKNYSGLVNQSVIALSITVLCITSQELMKRRRRGKTREALGSRESWEFGYLYHGRSWARHPSPPSPGGWPLSWVKQVVSFPESKLNELRGVDAALYIRFLRGCFWFTVLHSLTTFPILFPIHVHFSEDGVSPKSMTRASISSLVQTSTGLSLLWIHICLLIWVTATWLVNLLWISKGAFRFRAAGLVASAARVNAGPSNDTTYYPHPHPQYGFADVAEPPPNMTEGLRLRSVMVSNLPGPLRNEKDLKEYFEYYMSRKLELPSLGLAAANHPGFLNKTFAFLFNRAKRLPAHLPPTLLQRGDRNSSPTHQEKQAVDLDRMPVIERVVIARKMTELASLLERREECLKLLETAHIKLANKALSAVKKAMADGHAARPLSPSASKSAEVARQKRTEGENEVIEAAEEGLSDEDRMKQLLEALEPFVTQFEQEAEDVLRAKGKLVKGSKHLFRRLRPQDDLDSNDSQVSGRDRSYPPRTSTGKRSASAKTVWDALLRLPRSTLDAYQPLVNLSHLFRGKTVPSIDYYTTKLNLLSSLITENRAKAVTDFDPVSTAFVTFANPADARRACKYLAVHPNNPLACLVTMAPMYQDIDWIRIMKSSFKAEFLKDWVVNLGVWAFTLFWLFPVSLLVGLVSIQNISLFWPTLKAYLDKHKWESEVIQSFLPTLLVALLALLIPLILLLIAKKAHTITTLSAMHDRMMTRYYKFLVVNVLVFFCVGTAALQSFLLSFRSATRPDLLEVIATSFPTAGPFYVGWLIFTTAIHGGFEITLLGLPLILYPSTRRQVTPRKRAVGTRPRTFNFYYWLPNHLLVIHILMLFAILNPLVIPFGTLYFLVACGVVKNQLIHVYAKHYEGNGQILLIRIIRYSLDGLLFGQAVFLAYMVVLKKSANVGISAVLIVITALSKLLLTRACRIQFEIDDIAEADILCGTRNEEEPDSATEGNEAICSGDNHAAGGLMGRDLQRASRFTWKLPKWAPFTYSDAHRPYAQRRQPNPFGPHARHHSENNQSPHYFEERQPLEKSRSDEDRREWRSRMSPRPLDTHFGWNAIEAPASVIPHPPPVPWDDQTTIDLPYDNPFYVRTISNVLWLPRNPAGLLDLDDTVDLKTSLTVETSAAQLGTWLGLPEMPSPVSMTPMPSDGSTPADNPPSILITRHQPDGTEDIDLPLTIAKRVQAKEGDVEQTLRPRRPSTLYNRKSSTSISGTSVGGGPWPAGASGQRRPTLLGEAYPSLLPPRSFSPPTNAAQGRARSSSIMSTLYLTPRHERAPSVDEFGLRPDTHAQADLVANNNASASRTSLTRPKLTRAQNVSTHQAIVHEVLAEEEHAFANRVEAEMAEADKARTTKSWLLSWMFRKSH